MSENKDLAQLDLNTHIQPSQISQMDALDIIQTRQDLFNKIMEVAIKSTVSNDWIDQEGKPYLKASGAEKVARRFGVRVFDIEIEREDFEDDGGKMYVYTVFGKAAFGASDLIEAIGTCSSRDKFFGKAKGAWKNPKDIDVTNIKKKAYTNFLNNAIKRLLGLRDFSWQDLERYGVSRGGKETVVYKKTEEQVGGEDGLFWEKAFDGKTFLFAKIKYPLTKDGLEFLGFSQSKKNPDLMFAEKTDFLQMELKKIVEGEG